MVDGRCNAVQRKILFLRSYRKIKGKESDGPFKISLISGRRPAAFTSTSSWQELRNKGKVLDFQIFAFYDSSYSYE